MSTQVPRASSARTKLLVNSILAISFCVISAPHLTQIPLHEWLSVAFIVLIFVHLILSWKWIVGVTRRFLSTLRGTTRFNFSWDVVLYTTMTVVMVTGVLISEAALPALGFLRPHDRFWGIAHTLSSQLILVLVGVHLAMHWDWIVVAVKRFVSPAATAPTVERPTSRAWWIAPTSIIAIAACAVTLATLAVGEMSFADRLRSPARSGRTPRAVPVLTPPAATPRDAPTPDAAPRPEGQPPALGTNPRADPRANRANPRADRADRADRANRPKPTGGRMPLQQRIKRTIRAQGLYMGVPFLLTLGALAILRITRRRAPRNDDEVLAERVA